MQQYCFVVSITEATVEVCVCDVWLLTCSHPFLFPFALKLRVSESEPVLLWVVLTGCVVATSLLARARAAMPFGCLTLGEKKDYNSPSEVADKYDLGQIVKS